MRLDCDRVRSRCRTLCRTTSELPCLSTDDDEVGQVFVAVIVSESFFSNITAEIRQVQQRSERCKDSRCGRAGPRRQCLLVLVVQRAYRKRCQSSNRIRSLSRGRGLMLRSKRLHP